MKPCRTWNCTRCYQPRGYSYRHVGPDLGLSLHVHYPIDTMICRLPAGHDGEHEWIGAGHRASTALPTST